MLGGRFTSLTIALLVIGGCSSESSGSLTTTSTVVVSGAETTSASVDVTEPVVASTTASPDTSAVPDMNDLSVCAATKWTVLADQVDNVFEDTPLASMEGFSWSVDGEGLLDLRADGTYTYVPAFTVAITVAGQTGTGEWSGTLEGTWQIDGDQLVMAQTNNALTGSITVFGQSQPLPTLRTFSGNATVVECTPETFKYELSTPIGPVAHTLVLAG